jgi:hypothetical protein
MGYLVENVLIKLKKMRKSLFKKAAIVLKENRIILESETDTAIFFKVIPSGKTADLLPEEMYQVMFQYQDFCLKHSCTCKNMSSSQPTNLCSHKIACINYITDEEAIKTN